MAVGVGGRRPNNVSAVERISGIQQVNTAEFVITVRAQAGANQVSLVGEEQRGISVGSEVDARAVFQIGDSVGLPNLIAGAGLEANQLAGCFG